MYICIYVYIYIYVDMYICIYVYMHMLMYAYIYIRGPMTLVEAPSGTWGYRVCAAAALVFSSKAAAARHPCCR